MNKSGFSPLSDSNVVNVLRDESEEWIGHLTPEETRAIKKYTKNSGDPKDDKFYYRLNAMLRGDEPMSRNFSYYADQISSAISKFNLTHDIVCYRGIDVNPYLNIKIGSVFSQTQFISTSATKKGAFSGKNCQITIKVPKGTKGAYIELLSKYPKQREFILDKSCKYKLISVSKNSAELEVIV